MTGRQPSHQLKGEPAFGEVQLEMKELGRAEHLYKMLITYKKNPLWVPYLFISWHIPSVAIWLPPTPHDRQIFFEFWVIPEPRSGTAEESSLPSNLAHRPPGRDLRQLGAARALFVGLKRAGTAAGPPRKISLAACDLDRCGFTPFSHVGIDAIR